MDSSINVEIPVEYGNTNDIENFRNELKELIKGILKDKKRVTFVIWTNDFTSIKNFNCSKFGVLLRLVDVMKGCKKAADKIITEIEGDLK